MKYVSPRMAGLLTALAVLATAAGTWAQPVPTEELPLAKDLNVKEGQTVTPAYEGWYENPDGTISAVFGYYNRNAEEVVEVPVGENNRIEGGPDRGQPTKFMPGRHWGTFAVNLPEDAEEVVWHLETQGKSFDIPANLEQDYVVDAIKGDANGNFPPEIRFSGNESFSMGPAGVTTGPLETSVGSPVTISVEARDDGVGGNPLSSSSSPPPLSLAWLKHQGPGEVSFSQSSASIPVEGGEASTEVSFSEPGEYVVRLRVNDASGRVGGGHSQCCWTNGFVEVNVSE